MPQRPLLAKETAYFEEHDKEFRRRYEGEYTLIHGERLVGSYSEEAAAVADGIRKFGTDPFLVRRPGEAEPVLKAPAYSLGLL